MGLLAAEAAAGAEACAWTTPARQRASRGIRCFIGNLVDADDGPGMRRVPTRIEAKAGLRDKPGRCAADAKRAAEPGSEHAARVGERLVRRMQSTHEDLDEGLVEVQARV